MRTENIKVKLRDGTMGAYVAYPDKTPVGAIIAIMSRSPPGNPDFCRQSGRALSGEFGG